MFSIDGVSIYGMVQADLFFAYAIGAGLAFAASRQLIKRNSDLGDSEETQSDDEVGGSTQADSGTRFWGNPYLLKTVLYLSLLFIPSVVYLLWAFPSWETMYVGDRSMPAWLIATFMIAMSVLGVLGFSIVDRLLARRRGYLAYLQVVAAYFVMFFILVHGWDGRGYQRLLSVSEQNFAAWKTATITSWLSSDIALTLLVMGVALIPILFWMQFRWFAQGSLLVGASSERSSVSAYRFLAIMLITILVVSLGSSVVASLSIHLLGWIFGLVVFAVFAWFAVIRPGGLAGWLYKQLALDETSSLHEKPLISGDRARTASAHVRQTGEVRERSGG